MNTKTIIKNNKGTIIQGKIYFKKLKDLIQDTLEDANRFLKDSIKLVIMRGRV